MPRPASLATLAALGGLALALFGAWMHWAVLDPRNVGWLLAGEDRGQSAIGLAAYLRAGHWPSLHEPLLAAPEGMGLLFTDSIPLLGLALGPFAGVLPPGMQFIGPWLLLCVALQVTFAWLLLRPHAPDRLAALLGTVLLAAMPALFNRYGHASLCAQWLVLWALWVFVEPRRAERVGWWLAVLGVAATVHSYLLLMVAAFWGGAVLRLVGAGAWRRALPLAVLPAALVAAIMAWHGVLAGGYASTGTYGAFPLALDAWWNPANPGYTALLPASPDDHGRGYEGLNYLGAGLLALAVLAAGAALRRREEGVAAGPSLRTLTWLLPGFAVILVVAVGPQPLWRGQPLATARLPAGWVDALDPVRAAGRLAWPVTYTFAYVVVAAASRWGRATLILGGALALQVVDLMPMLAAVRATSAAADDALVFRRTVSPRWAALVAQAGAVEFEPAEPFRDLQLMEEVAWRAVAACRPVRYFYASRERRATRRRIDADAAAFRTGRLDPTRLYVVLDGRAPAAVADRMERLDGIAIVAPTRAAPPPPCVSPASSSPRPAS